MREAKQLVIREAKMFVVREAKMFVGLCSVCGGSHKGKPRHKNEIVVDNIIKKYMKLVEWASRGFSKNYTFTQYQPHDFYGAGIEMLSSLLLKKDLFCNEDEFGKYFKTCLFRGLRQMQLKSHSKKRFGHHMSFDKLSPEELQITRLKIPLRMDSPSEGHIPYNTFITIPYKTDGGINASEYNIMVDDCRKLLSGVERKIFDCLVNPPEDLVTFILTKRSRKEKFLLMNNRKEGAPVLAVNPDYVISFLKKNGVKAEECRKAYKNVKSVVGKYLHG